MVKSGLITYANGGPKTSPHDVQELYLLYSGRRGSLVVTFSQNSIPQVLIRWPKTLLIQTPCKATSFHHNFKGGNLAL